jgi:ATP:ADP antiporter, AAA family
MSGILKKALRVEGDEVSSILWTLLFGSFLGVSVSLYDLASVTNFLEIYDKSYLPGAIICSGLLGIFTANTFISIQNWVSYTKVATLTIFTLIILLIVVYLWHAAAPGGSIEYISFVLTGPFTTMALLVFWGLFEKLFDLAQGRRLAMGAESGMVIASVSALVFIAETNDGFFKNTSNLYMISCGNLVLSLFTMVVIALRNSELRKVVINVQYIKAYNNYKKLIKQPYILLLALFSLISSISFFLTDYTYLVFVSDLYTSHTGTLNFLAGFSAAMIGLGFLIQIFIVRWINEKYGYQVSLMVLPALVGLFTAIYAVLGTVEGYNKENTVFFFIFMLVCISKLLFISLYRSLEFSTFKFFFMPLENMLRADVQSKIERVVREAGKVVSGLILISIAWYFDISYLPYILLGFIIVWCFINIRMNKAYRDKLKISLDKPEAIEKKERVSSSVIDELIRLIPQAEVQQIEIYLSLLKILDPVVYKSCILNLLEHENEEIQKLSLLETSELCLLPAIPVLVQIQHSKFYPVLKTRDLIDKVYAQLKAAEFRLEKVKYIEQLTLSKLRRERVFGALLAAYAEESMKPRLLNKLFRDTDGKVRYSAVVSSAASQSADLQKNLIEKLADTYYSNASLSAITATGEEMFPFMENAFYLTGQDEKIQLRIVQAYGRLGTESAVQLLLKKLNYTNQNVSRAAFEAVSGCGFNITGERVLQFKAELEEYVNVLVWNISAYLDLKKLDASEVLLEAMLSEIESNYNSLFKLLTLLYDPKTIALIKENIFSKDPEKSEYAFGLVEVTLADEIKPFLLPVLANSSYEDKLREMQAYFPTDPLPKVDILFDLIQRDYKYVNRWTKACALKELSEEKSEIDPDIFVANVINPDSLLSETAAVALYIKAPRLFPPTFNRFVRELGTGYSEEVVNKITIPERTGIEETRGEVQEAGVSEAVNNIKKTNDKEDYFTAPSLRFEIIKFLKGVNEFEYVPGIVLMELARITQFLKFLPGDVIASFNTPDNLDYFLLRSGKVNVLKNEHIFKVYHRGSFINNFHLMPFHQDIITLIAETEVEIYRIRHDEFNEVMSFFDEIPWSIVKSNKINAKDPVRKEMIL